MGVPRDRRRSWIVIAAIALSLAACTTDTPSPPEGATPASVPSQPTETVPGCVPNCGPAGRVGETIALPEGAYRTDGFFGGHLRLSFADAWLSGEDSSGEFNAWPKDSPDDGLYFWLDVYPVEDFDRVRAVPLTTDGWLRWLRAEPNLTVSEPRDATIGRLPATTVDVSVAPGAETDEVDDPWCVKHHCRNFLGFGQWDGLGTWGIADTGAQRLYFADVSYGGERHLLVVTLAPATDLDAFAERAQQVLDTVEVPVEPA